MIEQTLEVLGADQLMAGFAGIEKILDNLEPILEPIGKEALTDIQHVFDVAGPGWQEQSESTRKRQVGPHRILWDTGALRDSFAKDAAGNIFRGGPKDLEVGTDIFYGIYHQEGRGHNPVRLIINKTPEEELKYGAMLAAELTEKIRALGFQVN